MKKIITLFYLINCLFIIESKGQAVFYSQNFETTQNAMPAGWHQQVPSSDPTNMGWTFDTISPGYPIPEHTWYALVDDYDYNTANVENKDTLFTTYFSCAGHNHVMLSLDAFYTAFQWAGNVHLALTYDSGKTWVTFASILNNISSTWEDSLVFDFSLYAGGKPSVMLAFAYDDGANVFNEKSYVCALDNIRVFEPLNYDLSITSQNLTYLMQVGTPYYFNGTMFNHGGDTVNSIQMNYSVNGGPAQSCTLTGLLGFFTLTSHTWASSVPYIPTVAGLYHLKFWADSINGTHVDQNHSNDTLYQNFLVVDTIQPKQVLVEEFTGVDCSNCLAPLPNLDSVCFNSQAICSPVFYHANWVGADAVDIETWGPVVSYRVNYYPVGYVPDCFIDGFQCNPNALTNGLSSVNVQKEAAIGSPFNININSCNYDALTDSFTVSTIITSHTVISPGLSARIVLTVDTIRYDSDQSIFYAQSTFLPPIGTNSSGFLDYLYPYELNYPNDAEVMMPGAYGTTLPAFTTGQTYTITTGWKKNHPWSSNGKVLKYDSSTCHLVVYIQDSIGNPLLNIPPKYVYQSNRALILGTSVLTSSNKLSTENNIEVYPNPSSGVFTIVGTQNFVSKIEVYDVLGKMVYSNSYQPIANGYQPKTIDLSGQPDGVYLYRVMTNDGSYLANGKLIIER